MANGPGLPLRDPVDLEVGTATPAQFLLKVDEILRRVSASRYILFPRDMRGSTVEAIDKARRVLTEAANSDFDDTKLEKCGFGQDDTAFKFGVFDRFAKVFHFEGGSESLNDLLDIAKSLLGSLGEALGVLEPITELIDMIQKLMEISERRKRK